ncbi:MAG: hypothetical protein KJ674_03960 [Nanoarchaeota archaeon]|nr:hypothetical protein [Nanoarchaeota archaeon]
MFIKTNYGSIPYKELIVSKISNTPKLKIKNYIDIMYDKEIDTKSSNLYLKINKLKKEITLPEVLNKKYGLKEVSYWKAKSSSHKITLPTHLTPKLSYLVGYLYGDGGLKDIRRSYNQTKRFEHKIIVGDEFEIQILGIIKNLFKELFNLDTPVRYERIAKGQKLYYLNPTSKVIYRFLTKLFDHPEGPKKNKLQMPNLIKNSNKPLRLWFFKGVFDADGDVRAMENHTKKHKSPRIKLKMVNKNFIYVVKDLLNSDFNLGFT